MSIKKIQTVEMSLGHRIRMVRDTAKLSREDFAEKLNVTPATIGRYEKGERTPDAEFLHQLVLGFNCDPEWLLMGGGSMLRDEPREVDDHNVAINDSLLLTVLEAFEDVQQMHWYNPSLMTERNKTALIYTLCVLFSDNKLKHLVSREFIAGQAGFVYLMITTPGNLFSTKASAKTRLKQVGISDELNLFGKTAEILSKFMVA